ncbi:GNAT family N-acetyltransferase [Microbacterium koreense]|uniref:GNAT family N-acetyltransferase n=1 Tax=Microbacterium koreense TaxID=323761 RepID=A0ABW2ZP61_9MICO
MSEPTEDTSITRNDTEHRYEIHVGDVLAGFTEFEVNGRGAYVYPHTVIDPAFRGRGLSGELIGYAMRDSAARGETVVPVCPAVVKWLRENEVPGLDIAWRSES